MDKEREFWYHGTEVVRHFLEGMAAAQDRLNRGYETQSALECIVLSAAIVDGLLRMGVVLKAQLDSNSHEFDERLLKQTDSEAKFTERWVINQALQRNVISSKLGAKLHALYDARNKCVHRYVISDVTYDVATNLVFDYDEAIKEVRANIKMLEQRQVEAGVGLVAAEANTDDPEYDAEIKRWIKEMAVSKEQRPNRGR